MTANAAMAQEGALVAVHYGTSWEAAEAVVHDIEQNGGTAFTIGTKLGSSESIQPRGQSTH
jgi:3-oxoacyl-[acyl-carrier protein] reductase